MANRIALIENNVVTNVIIGEIAWVIENAMFGVVIDDESRVSIGWLFNGKEFAEPEPEKQNPIMTRLEFMRRFTMQERIATRAATLSDPILADVHALLELNQEVNLDDADTQMAVGYMAQLKILTPERVAEILDL